MATVALVERQVDDPRQATAGRPEGGRVPGPPAAQQDVRGQATWPACVIWGTSLAFSESLLPQLHSGDGHRARPTCCRRCGQKLRCEAAACCIDVYADSRSGGATSRWWVLSAKPGPCPTCAPAPAPARSQPPCAPPSGAGSAGRAPARWGPVGGGTWTCSTGVSPRTLQRSAVHASRQGYAHSTTSLLRV